MRFNKKIQSGLDFTPPHYFQIFTYSELALITGYSKYALERYMMIHNIPKQWFYNKKLPSYLPVSQIKYCMMHSTPRTLNPELSIEYIALACGVSTRTLPWGTTAHYQQHARCRKFKPYKIKAKASNLLELENLSLHIHTPAPGKFLLTHYKSLEPIKTANLSLPLVKELLESQDVLQTLKKHASAINESFTTTPVAIMQDFMPDHTKRITI